MRSRSDGRTTDGYSSAGRPSARPSIQPNCNSERGRIGDCRTANWHKIYISPPPDSLATRTTNVTPEMSFVLFCHLVFKFMSMIHTLFHELPTSMLAQSLAHSFRWINRRAHFMAVDQMEPEINGRNRPIVFPSLFDFGHAPVVCEELLSGTAKGRIEGRQLAIGDERRGESRVKARILWWSLPRPISRWDRTCS